VPNQHFDIIFVLLPVEVTLWFVYLLGVSVPSDAGFQGIVPSKQHIERSKVMPKTSLVDFREVRSRITTEKVLEHYGDYWRLSAAAKAKISAAAKKRWAKAKAAGKNSL
jgi:hypothetical protein